MKWVQTKCLLELKKLAKQKWVSPEEKAEKGIREGQYFPVRLILNWTSFALSAQMTNNGQKGQKYFGVYSNFTLSIFLARKEIFAAPGLCSAHQIKTNWERNRRKEENLQKVPQEP